MASLIEVQRVLLRLRKDPNSEPLEDPQLIHQLLGELGFHGLAAKWLSSNYREVIDKLKNHDMAGSDEGLWWLGVELEKIFVASQFAKQKPETKAVFENELGRWVQYRADQENISIDEACKRIARSSRISLQDKSEQLTAKRCKDAWKRWSKKDVEKRKPPTGAFWIE